MKIKLFAVYDLKSQCYQAINPYRTAEEASRAFGNSCQDPKSDFFNHAEDFVLYCLGEYFDDTGSIIPMKAPLKIISAVEASKLHRAFYAARQLDVALAS